MDKEALLQQLVDWTNSAKDLASEQTPLFIEEVARYGVASSAFLSAMCLLMIPMCIWMFIKVWNNSKFNDDHVFLLIVIFILFGRKTLSFR